MRRGDGEGGPKLTLGMRLRDALNSVEPERQHGHSMRSIKIRGRQSQRGRRPRIYVNAGFTIKNDFFTGLSLLVHPRCRISGIGQGDNVSLAFLGLDWEGKNYGWTSGNTDLKHRSAVLMNRKTHCQCLPSSGHGRRTLLVGGYLCGSAIDGGERFRPKSK